MPTTRRGFLAGAVAGGTLGIARHPGIARAATDDAGALLAKSSVGERPAARGAVRKAEKPLRILILGGTGFIGPPQVRCAVARGHRVTLFNRGRTRPGLFPDVEQLIGDRNGQLDALKGREWDVVIDNPATLPRWVRDAAGLLKDSAGRYLFISTISVYADNSRPGMDETAPLATLRDPNTEEITGETYGGLKALAEREAEKAFSGRAAILRPGLIVGPGDESDRFTYWPARIDRGGEVLAPGEPSDPVQFIDARDLGEWCIRVAEDGTTGIYNAVGPKPSPIPMSRMLEEIRKAAESKARFTWVDAGFLAEQGVSPWSDMPVWIPPRNGMEGFSRVSNRRAVSKGLTFRPVLDTAKTTLEDYRNRPEERKRLRAGLTAEREAVVLAAWRARKD